MGQNNNGRRGQRQDKPNFVSEIEMRNVVVLQVRTKKQSVLQWIDDLPKDEPTSPKAPGVCKVHLTHQALSAEKVANDIESMGYQLIRIYGFRVGPNKGCVCFVYKMELDDDEAEMDTRGRRDLDGAIEVLTDMEDNHCPMTYSACYVWDNGPDVAMAINLDGAMPRFGLTGIIDLRVDKNGLRMDAHYEVKPNGDGRNHLFELEEPTTINPSIGRKIKRHVERMLAD